MTKYVRETNAAKQLSAWIIMKGAREVATVQAYFTQSRTTVNVFQRSESAERCYKKAHKGAEYDDRAAWDEFGFQHSSGNAGSIESALAGLCIDGHYMTDHCSRFEAPKVPKGRSTFPRDFKAKKGYSLANFLSGDKTYPDGARMYPNIPESESGYCDCYRSAGLRYLSELGYSVISAI